MRIQLLLPPYLWMAELCPSPRRFSVLVLQPGPSQKGIQGLGLPVRRCSWHPVLPSILRPSAKCPQRPRVKEEPHKPSRIKDESPKLSRTKEEPLDRNTPDMKPQVNPWVKYLGPSPFIQRSGMFRAPSTLKPLEVKGAFILPQPERELSSDEDETSGKQTKQHLVASSKRSSPSDGAEGRRLKRVGRFV